MKVLLLLLIILVTQNCDAVFENDEGDYTSSNEISTEKSLSPTEKVRKEIEHSDCSDRLE